MESQPTPNATNTIRLEEVILLAAPTVMALSAVHTVFSVNGWAVYLVDAAIVGIVPPITYRLLRPHLRATIARKKSSKGKSA